VKSIVTKLALATVAAGTIVGVAGSPAFAAGVSPTSTLITASSTSLKFAGTLNGVAFTVTCTSASLQFTTPASGYGPVNVVEDPVIGSCTDSLSGTDTVTANHTNGDWTILATSTPSVQLTISQAGATFSTSALAGCVVTAAPSAAVTVTASFNNTTHRATFTNQSVAFSGNAACGTVGSSGTMSGVFTTSPSVTIT
jgi:hypothetical protein